MVVMLVFQRMRSLCVPGPFSGMGMRLTVTTSKEKNLARWTDSNPFLVMGLGGPFVLTVGFGDLLAVPFSRNCATVHTRLLHLQTCIVCTKNFDLDDGAGGLYNTV